MLDVNTYGEVQDLGNKSPIAGDSNLNYNYDTGLLSWNNGDGYQRLVIASRKKPIQFKPYDNVTYPLGSIVRGGGEVVYRGAGNSINLIGIIDPTSDYYYYVFSFNGVQSNEVYRRIALGLFAPAPVDGEGIFDYTFDYTFE